MKGNEMRQMMVMVAVMVAAVEGFAGALTLVKDGAPAATIVLAEKPTQAAQLGAYELQHIVKLSTGATLPIVREPEPPTGVAIYVGASKALEQRGMKGDAYPLEEYEVRTFADAIALIGHDSPQYAKIDYEKGGFFPVSYNYHATLWAVYDFLEQRVGARFYMPGDLGTCVPSVKTLAVEPLNLRRQPDRKAHRLSTMGTPWGKRHHSTARDRALLAFRWRSCEFYGLAHHNTYSMWYRYWKKSPLPHVAKEFVAERPDMFAKGYEGKSSGSTQFPDDHDLPPNLCYTNPDTIRVLADQAVRTANGETIPWTAGGPKVPGQPVYTYPMLGEDNNIYCKCPACQALAPKGVEGPDRNTWIYYGFINALCREVARRDKSISIASGIYQLPMQDVPLEENMTLMYMFGINTWYHPVIRERHLAIYDYWRKKAGKRPLTLWLYMLSPYWDMWENNTPKKLFPGFYPHHVAPIARKFVDDGIAGWFSETFIDYSYLESWVALNTCYDRNFPADREIDAFFDNFFGAAAKPMREYWKTVEDAYWNPASYPKSFIGTYAHLMPILAIWCHNESINWGVGTRERVERLDRLFKEAKGLAKTDLERRRLDFLDDTLHAQMLEGLVEHEKRALLQAVPPPHAFVRAGTNAILRLEKSLDNAPAKHSMTVALTHDGKNLVFTGADDQPFDGNAKAEDKWANNVQILFADNAENALPVNDFILTPQGGCYLCRHYDQNGVVKWGLFKTSATCASRIDREGRWHFKFTLPFAEVLPEESARTVTTANCDVRMKVFRSRGDERIGWGPTFAPGYICDPARRGRLVIGGGTKGEVKAIEADFRSYTGAGDFREKAWSPSGTDSPNVVVKPGVGLQLKQQVILRSQPRTPVATGDTAVFRVRAKGTGALVVRAAWHENLPWDKDFWLYKEPVGATCQSVKVAAETAETVLRFPVPAIAGHDVSAMSFWLWSTDPKTDVTVESVKLEIEPAVK